MILSASSKANSEASMLYRVGRLLQLAGMIILPLAIAGNLVPGEPLSLGDSLKLSGVGVAVFALGWLIQQRAKRG
jgi:drug/metabolite transporter (DMT)-like permease